MSDPYLEMVQEHWDEITMMYRLFEEKNPIIELDVQPLRIFAYPAREYLGLLSDRTREQTRKLYRRAVADGSIMVFVRDEAKRVFRSFIFPPADEDV